MNKTKQNNKKMNVKIEKTNKNNEKTKKENRRKR